MNNVDSNSESRSKLIYRDICKKYSSLIPLYSKDWWLDSVCLNGSWDVAILEKNGEVIAALPYYIKKRYLFSVLDMPPLTQSFMIWVKYPENIKKHRVMDYQVGVVRDLINMIPIADYVSFNIFYTFSNLLPFYWYGFKESVRYTYVIDNLSDLDKVYSEFDRNFRNRIRKAERVVKTVFSESIDDFYEMNKKSFNRQNIEIPYTYEFIKHHDEILRQHKARKIFFAIDDAGRIHSALYLVWDDSSSYAHLVGDDPELRSSGAGIKLFWDAIQYTSNDLKLNTFDFDGSMIRPIERMRRSFGADQRKFSNLSKYNNIYYRIVERLRYAIH